MAVVFFLHGARLCKPPSGAWHLTENPAKSSSPWIGAWEGGLQTRAPYLPITPHFPLSRSLKAVMLTSVKSHEPRPRNARARLP